MKTFFSATVLLLAAVNCRSLPALPYAASPESEGVDSQAILDWLDACEQKLEYLHGFVLVRHGKIVAEGSWRPFDTLNRTHMLYSHSKSFTSTAVGMLADEGKIDLDERIVEIFPELSPAEPAENLRQLRVRDLLTMNAGMDYTDAERKDIQGDWVRAFLHNPVEHRPGSVFKYDSCCTHVLAAIVERRAGCGLMEFLDRRLFGKIGIAGAWSTTSPTGVACGGWGMNMTTRDLARFGQLYLNEGVWNGERLLSRDWVQLSTARHTASGANTATRDSGSDWDQGYGFQFWRCRHGAFRADGAGGQLTVVMREQDAVLSVHAGLGPMQEELNLVWQHLLPGFAAAALPEAPEKKQRLDRRLAALQIPARGGTVAKLTPRKATASDNPFGITAGTLATDGDGWIFSAGGKQIKIGNGSWQTTVWAFPGGTVEPLFAFVGKLPFALSANPQPDGSLAVKWLLATGPQQGEFRIEPAAAP